MEKLQPEPEWLIIRLQRAHKWKRNNGGVWERREGLDEKKNEIAEIFEETAESLDQESRWWPSFQPFKKRQRAVPDNTLTYEKLY